MGKLLYLNKVDRRNLYVEEDCIEKIVNINKMLMLPKRVNSIYDTDIVFIENESFNIKDIQEYVFLAEEDLPCDIKLLYMYYDGYLSAYMKKLNIVVDEDELALDMLERLKGALDKYGCKPDSFMTKLFYRDICLSNPSISYDYEEWKLIDNISVS